MSRKIWEEGWKKKGFTIQSGSPPGYWLRRMAASLIQYRLFLPTHRQHYDFAPSPVKDTTPPAFLLDGTRRTKCLRISKKLPLIGTNYANSG